MFERFTDRARHVTVLAQDEARSLNHDHIDTEHLLLGLIREEEGTATKVLVALEISAANVRRDILKIAGDGTSQPGSRIPFTPRAKKVLEFSLREAIRLGHNYIGTEHILLGLIREERGVAAHVLVDLGGTLDVVRKEVIRQLVAVRDKTEPDEPDSGVPDE